MEKKRLKEIFLRSSFSCGRMLRSGALIVSAKRKMQVFLSQKEPNANYGIRTRYYFLSSFRIKPDFRYHGLGSLLLKECEKQVRLHRIRDIYLNCARNNDRARWFYQEHGFKVVRIDEGTWTFVNDEGFVVSEPQNAYLMRKALSWFKFK